MLRQLLTLLAIVSGFTLAAEPVPAAQAGAVSIVAAAAEDCQTVVSAPLQFGALGPRGRAQKAKPCERPPVIVLVPTVQLQVDRARE